MLGMMITNLSEISIRGTHEEINDKFYEVF